LSKQFEGLGKISFYFSDNKKRLNMSKIRGVSMAHGRSRGHKPNP
jgi:hypothetical protein